MNKFKDIKSFLIDDMSKHGAHGSWDWMADYRFSCKFFPEKVEILHSIVYGGGVAQLRMGLHDEYCKEVKSARLRALRRMVKNGIIKSYWTGTEEGGVNFYGINRYRVYELKEDESQV